MNDVVKLAIAKRLEKETKNVKLAAGVHQIDEIVTLRVKGEISKAKDGDYQPTTSIPLLATMALFIEKSGIQRENVKNLLVEAMTEAIEAELTGAEVVSEQVRDIETAMEHVREVVGQLPRLPRAGKTTVNVIIDELQLVEVN